VTLALDHASLKARQRAQRDSWPQPLALRVHRALSWLERAEQEPDDHDARFFLFVTCRIGPRHRQDAGWGSA
jgi:hypothetical protein